jgi:DNA excision repair protein ERCC-3
MNQHKPLIVQSNSTLMLEVENPDYASARDAIGIFAHLEKSPEHIHTYCITRLSLWNAAALGITSEEVIERLKHYSKYPLPDNIVRDVRELMERFGYFTLQSHGKDLLLVCKSSRLMGNIAQHPQLSSLLKKKVKADSYAVDAAQRGILKQTLIHIGYPVQDRAGYVDGAPYEVDLRCTTRHGSPFSLRSYQNNAARSYIGDEHLPGGNGVVVLPCGAGKTVVGMAVMGMLKRMTLILVTNITAARQWREELIDKTTISPIEKTKTASLLIMEYSMRKTGALSSTTRFTCCRHRYSSLPPNCRPGDVWASPPHSFVRMVTKRMCSHL